MKNFKETEFYDFSKMDKSLLERLDAVREYVGSRMIITSSNEPFHKHQTESQHYKGFAVDVIFPDWQGSLFSLYLILERFGFNGLGIYPRWRYNNEIKGGFHLDMRPLTDLHGARWIGFPEQVENSDKFITKYFALNSKNLIDLKIVNPPKNS